MYIVTDYSTCTHTHLNIPVYNTKLMTVQQSLQYLLDAMGGIFFAVKLPRNNVVKKFPSSDEIKDHVADVILLEDVVQLNYR